MFSMAGRFRTLCRLGERLQIFTTLRASGRNKRIARVAVGYSAAAWLLAQLADLVLDAFNTPDWVMQLIIAALVVGLPFAVLGAWIMGRDEPASGQGSSNTHLDDIGPGETQYARSDDVSIAYQVTGAGPVDIVMVNGWISNVEIAWEHPRARYFLQRLSSFVRLINFDKRGTGLSDRSGALPTFEHRMDDVRAVMDAAGSERAVLFGYSEGGPMSALFAATYPERTLGLVLYGTYMKRIRSDDYPWAPTREERLQAIEMVEQTWGKSLDVEYFAPSVVGDTEFVNWLTSYWRRSASPRSAAELLRMNTDIDVCHVLPTIRVPTLIMHRTGDRDAQVDEGRYIAEKIPNASFVELSGADHLIWAGEMDDILDPIEHFIKSLDGPYEFDTVLATLLVVRLEPGAQINADIESYIASQLDRFRGERSEADQYGTLASFDGTGRAIRCALTVRDYSREHDLPCRIGVHVGECRREGTSVSDAPVRISHAVANRATVGEIMVTSTVKDLVSGFEFDAGQVTDLGGDEGEWTLYAVRG